MKKIFTIAVFGMVLGAYAANPIDGSYNTSLGWLAGLNANGEKATAVGAAAAVEATGITRTDFVGAGAGSYSDGLTDCVGIGFRSLAFGTNMNSVVGIGRDAFLGRKGLSKATWLNGRFVAYGQNNSFLLKGNPNIADTNAPIRYADGVLTLQADRIVVKGETTDGEGFAGLESPLTGYDLYVDCVNGDDAFAGTSPGTAKRTIDGASLTITNHGTRICLLPGTYTSTNLSSKLSGWTDERDPDFAVSIVAPYGPGQTAIVGDNIRQLCGNDDYPASITGCELRDFKGLTRYCPPYYVVCFSNCVFKGRCETSGGSANNGLFNGCTLYNCVIEAEMYPWSSISGSSQYKDAFSATFLDCNIIDSIIDPVWANPSGLFSCNSTFYNCYVNMGAADYADGVDGVSRFVDTTLIATNCVRFAAYGVHSSFHGCLLGLNNVENMLTPENHVLSVVTNADAVISQIGQDYRPTVSNWAFWFNGYDSQYERMKRDSMHNSIKSILAADNTVALPETTRVAFLASIKENEDANATHGEPPPIAKSRGLEEEEPATE